MKYLSPLACTLGLLASCADGVPTTISEDEKPTVVVYSPSTGSFPIPNDILFAGSLDGTLNIPTAPGDVDLGNPIEALNALDGWSTVAPFPLRFSRPIDFGTVVLGSTLRVLEVTTDTSVFPVGGPVTGLVGEVMTMELALSAGDPSGATLELRPTSPLKPGTAYMVIATNGILDAVGEPVGRDTEYAIVADEGSLVVDHPLAQLDLLVDLMHLVAGAAGTPSDSIVVAYSFTTQTIGRRFPIAGIESPVDSVTAAAMIASGDEATLIGLYAGGVMPPFVDFTGAFDGVGEPILGGSPATAGTFSDTDLIGTDVQAIYQNWGAGNGKVYVGSISIPSYSAVGSGDDDDTDPLTQPWTARFPSLIDSTRNLSWLNPIPKFQSMEAVPVLVIVPETVNLGDAPVTIFVHGITSSRAALLGVAQALADAGDAGRVGIAIDLPLHGLVEGADDLLPGALAQIGAEAIVGYGTTPGAVRERTFGLDLVDNLTGSPGSDGSIDSSGSHFLNLANLLTAKANIMQAVADLTALRELLPSIDLDGDGNGGDLSSSDVAFMGHSLGAMISIPTLAIQHNILGVQGLDPPAPLTLMAPGGGIAKLLQGSDAYGPQVDGTLDLQGVLPGTPEYEFFFFASQSVVDGVDPINFASLLAGTDITNMTPLHLIEVVGGGLADTLDGPEPTPSDLVVPNNVVGAPLSGTDPLVAELGLTEVTSANSPLTGTPGVAPAQGFVKYLKGKHSSLIVPPMQITSSEDEDFWYDDFIGSLIYQEMSSTAAAFWGLTPEITVGGFAVDNGVIQ
jgi:pimeloyl-ACP methyl ester carboxylesterase